MKLNLIKNACTLLFLLPVCNRSTAQLTLTSGCNLVTSNGTHIVLNNIGLTNTGTVTATGTNLLFTGTTTTSLSSASSLTNITLNKTAGGLTAGSNILLTGTLDLTRGVLDLNNYELNLGSTGTITNESSSGYVTGTSGGSVVATTLLNAPSGVNPGNLGLQITSVANLGSTTIRRGHQQQNILGTGNSVYRYYDVTPTNNSNLNATVRFGYQDNELAGISENNLILYTSSDGGTSWMQPGAESRNTTTNYVQTSGLQQLNRLTLAVNGIILPVKIVSFTGKLTPQGTELQWVTAIEQNNHHFEVEKSSNGIAFERFAEVLARGNSNTIQTYTALDTKFFSGTQFYRLKQVNTDGSFTYSKIIAVSKGGFTNRLISIYPSPAKNIVQVQFTSSIATKATLTITDANGRQVLSREVSTIAGLNSIMLDISNLATGTYQLSSAGINEPMRFIKIN